MAYRSCSYKNNLLQEPNKSGMVKTTTVRKQVEHQFEMRKHIIKHIIIVGIISAGLAFGREATVLLKPTLVTAQRAHKTYRLTTIKPTDLWSYSAVSDALKRLPGLTVVGDAGRVSSVFSKGTQSHHTLVFLDGMPIHDPSSVNGAVDFSQLSAHDHLKITVHHGAEASLYASSAIGGVITLDTQPATKPQATTASIETGNNQALKTSLGTQGIKGRVNYVLHGTFHRSSGMNSVPPALQSAVPSNAWNSPFSHQDLHARIATALTDYTTLTFFSHYHASTSTFRRPFYENDQCVDHHHHRVQLSIINPSSAWKHEMGIGLSRQEQRHYSSTTAQQDHTVGTRVYTNWRTVYQWSDVHETTANITGVHEHFVNHNPFTRAQINSLGIGVMHRWRLCDWLSLELGGRGEKNSLYPVPFTYHMVATFTPTPQWIFTAQLSKAYSPPTLYQTHVDLPFFRAAPGLKPETAHHVEVGMRYQTQNQQWAWGSAWFGTRIRDLITPNATFTTLVNLKQAQISGLMSFVEWAPTDAYSVLLTHTYVDARDRQTREPLLRRPRHHLCVTLGFKEGVWKAELTGTFLGKRVDVHPTTFQPTTNKAAFLLGARFSYEINTRFTVYARVENMAHRSFENPLGYRAPGFTWRIGLQSKF